MHYTLHMWILLAHALADFLSTKLIDLARLVVMCPHHQLQSYARVPFFFDLFIQTSTSFFLKITNSN